MLKQCLEMKARGFCMHVFLVTKNYLQKTFVIIGCHQVVISGEAKHILDLVSDLTVTSLSVY